MVRWYPANVTYTKNLESRWKSFPRALRGPLSLEHWWDQLLCNIFFFCTFSPTLLRYSQQWKLCLCKSTQLDVLIYIHILLWGVIQTYRILILVLSGMGWEDLVPSEMCWTQKDRSGMGASRWGVWLRVQFRHLPGSLSVPGWTVLGGGF